MQNLPGGGLRWEEGASMNTTLAATFLSQHDPIFAASSFSRIRRHIQAVQYPFLVIRYRIPQSESVLQSKPKECFDFLFRVNQFGIFSPSESFFYIPFEIFSPSGNRITPSKLIWKKTEIELIIKDD